MAKRMLVDATHPEETRVAVVNGNRLEELDFETAAKKQLKGNIYLAKVTRVEPSLQAAFVEYGGNRHGFLAFSEIHPDYYRIPIADRQALVAQEAAESAEIEARLDAEADAEAGENGNGNGEDGGGDNSGGDNSGGDNVGKPRRGRGRNKRGRKAPAPAAADGGDTAAERVDEIGGDEVEEAAERPRTRPLRSYKIQEVIKRRQIMLVQVTKEERGNKGAALTTYLSLAGRYCVLMPNTPRGGGVSRKIANPKDRKRMKAILEDLYIPDGMAVILRTAGMERTKAEIKRDLDYLLRLWDQIRAVTLESTAPTLIHEEANLIKRAIRDLYTKDIDEILVSGEQGYRIAKDFMRMLMPSHAKKVQLYKDETIPMFHRYQVETQIDAMHSQTVQLRSGGYIVINPTEALVAIDVNSGRSTRERNIEETAYKTNLEAAEEVARQLRLRDLAGLIVIDFIDMEDDRHNAAVERRLKEAMRTDRARIQLGKISPFGLLELSRQRLRPSLVETNFETCRHCGGAGVTRTIGSASLHVLRAIEEEGIRKRAREVAVHVPNTIALNILNQKRDSLAEIEARYGFRVYVEADDGLIAPDYRLERLKARTDDDEGAAVDTSRIMAETDAALAAEAREDEPAEAGEEERATEGDVEGRSKRRRKPRRRRKGDGAEGEAAEARGFRPDLEEPDDTGDDGDGSAGDGSAGEEAEERGGDGVAATLGEDDADRPRKKRRRGKRGGRRRAGRGEGEGDEMVAGDSGERDRDDEGRDDEGRGDDGGDGREDDIREADARDAAWPEPAAAQAVDDAAAAEPEAEPEPDAVTAETAAAETGAFEPEQAAAEPAETAAEPAKPKRRRSPAKAATKTEGAAKPRRSRKKAADAEPAEPEADADAPAAPAEAAAEEKPKRKRATRSRKKAEPADTAETPAETAEAEEKPKRKRPTRSRKKAEPAETPAAEPEASAEPAARAPADATDDRPADAGSDAPASEPPAVEAPAPAAAETPANDAGAAEDGTEDSPDDHTNVIDVPETPADSKPKRGWWRRVIDR